MTWTCQYEDRLFTMSDESMAGWLVERYYGKDRAVARRFAEWVDVTYTPWDALNDDPDRALRQWAEEMVQYRQDIVEELLSWAHCREVRG